MGASHGSAPHSNQIPPLPHKPGHTPANFASPEKKGCRYGTQRAKRFRLSRRTFPSATTLPSPRSPEEDTWVASSFRAIRDDFYLCLVGTYSRSCSSSWEWPPANRPGVEGCLSHSSGKYSRRTWRRNNSGGVQFLQESFHMVMA